MTDDTETINFYGVELLETTAWWCNVCGCLLVVSQDASDQHVADRFVYSKGCDEDDCPCHQRAAEFDASMNLEP